MNLPRGAWAIVEARKRGEVPADPVIVSFVGRVPGATNPQVFPEPGAWDWTFVADLDVILYVRKDTNLSHHLRAIAHHAREIDIWDVEAKAGITVWPVWKGAHVPEVTGTTWEERREAGVLLRWMQVRWTQRGNREFAA